MRKRRRRSRKSESIDGNSIGARDQRSNDGVKTTDALREALSPVVVYVQVEEGKHGREGQRNSSRPS